MLFPHYSPDPDCPQCHGSGTFTQDHGDPDYHGCGGPTVTTCDCRRPENREKIQQRCSHTFVCQKCGKDAPEPEERYDHALLLLKHLCCNPQTEDYRQAMALAQALLQQERLIFNT